MRKTTELFKINGLPMLTPDEEVQVSYEDIDSADAGRDQAGFMHRIPVRIKVANWNFVYDALTEEEKNYMENLFGDLATFTFTHPGRDGAATQTLCYRSKYSLSWKNARLGLWRNYSFTVIEC